MKVIHSSIPPIVLVISQISSQGKLSCPQCKSSVFHISRRILDRLISFVTPLRRYRCISMKCNWEGTLRDKRGLFSSIQHEDQAN